MNYKIIVDQDGSHNFNNIEAADVEMIRKLDKIIKMKMKTHMLSRIKQS